mgnify:CR=1 FL=1
MAEFRNELPGTGAVRGSWLSASLASEAHWRRNIVAEAVLAAQEVPLWGFLVGSIMLIYSGPRFYHLLIIHQISGKHTPKHLTYLGSLDPLNRYPANQ